MRLPWRAPLITLLVLFLGALALTEHYIISARPESRALAARPIPAATAIARAGNSGSTPTPPPPGWLRRLNYWRGLAGVAPAATDPAAAAGAAADARYIVKNYLAKNPRTPHFEDPHNPWFTPAGADAARHAQQDQVFGPGVTASSLDGIDGWIDGPLHRMGLLDPNLTAAQFASYCEPGACAALLVLDRQTPVVTGAVGARAPIMFPADRMQLDATRTTLIKSEWPEPLSLTCAGYVRPVGYAVTLQLGSSFVPKLISYSLARDGSQIEACGYDSLSYSNSDEATQQWAQEGLKDRGAIVIIPRAPLIPGASYEVALTVEAQTDPFGWGKPSPFAGQRRTYNWAFTVAR